MTDGWGVLIAVGVALVAIWVVLVAALSALGRRQGDPTRLRDALRLVPDVVRLLRRLVTDRSLPRGVRIRVALLCLYLLSPVDVVPDVVPVIGYADDVVLIVWVLRSVARRAGEDVLDRHWPGTDEGLRALKLLVGVQPFRAS